MSKIKYLSTLIKMFDGKPDLLAKKLLEHNVLKEDFTKSLEYNLLIKYYSRKNDISDEIPYFHNIDEINNFYNQLFKGKKIDDLDVKESDEFLHKFDKSELEILQLQLNRAVDYENFELADKIHKYIQMIGLDKPN